MTHLRFEEERGGRDYSAARAAKKRPRLGGNGRRRHDKLLAAPGATRTRPYDLATGIAGHDVTPALRARAAIAGSREVILRADKGTDHVMKHRKKRERRAAGRACRLSRFDLLLRHSPRHN